ncbi:MAG TPA: tryptophan synthase subunit alpha [Sphingomicrobium sp.]|nr:tryptophan synthase subunit alpha [Sphingomicrobium sp.]
MTSRYADMFDRCAAAGEGVFGAFLMLGDPDLATSTAMLDALVSGGADMLELGIPFSDPVADGPVIQQAASRALASGVRTQDCLALIAQFHARHAYIPIGILTYANIIAARGLERFAEEVAAAGVDSLLVADVPTLEAPPYAAAAQTAGLDLVMIAAPNTPRATLERIAAMSSGYTYCVARTGITGTDEHLSLDHAALFNALREVAAPPPVLGFGISTPAHVREALASGAAGVISGSAIVQRSLEGADSVRDFVSAMKAATRF